LKLTSQKRRNFIENNPKHKEEFQLRAS